MNTPPPITPPTRHEQAEAILRLRAWPLASRTLGRRAASAADFAEAFNLERIDLVAAIPDRATLLGLGRNRVGPADGLYVLDEDDGTFRVYRQERGESHDEVVGTFDEAREVVIDRLIQLGGIPFSPPS
ncbi:MAG: hypothetical protein H0V96_07300 [Acidimicrobiia bacterium]|nr:hypothetical protein [Acidimicrobiia bacterium]